MVEIWEIFGMTPGEWGRFWCEKMCANKPTKPANCGKCNFVDPSYNPKDLSEARPGGYSP